MSTVSSKSPLRQIMDFDLQVNIPYHANHTARLSRSTLTDTTRLGTPNAYHCYFKSKYDKKWKWKWKNSFRAIMLVGMTSLKINELHRRWVLMFMHKWHVWVASFKSMVFSWQVETLTFLRKDILLPPFSLLAIKTSGSCSRDGSLHRKSPYTTKVLTQEGSLHTKELHIGKVHIQGGSLRTRRKSSLCRQHPYTGRGIPIYERSFWPGKGILYMDGLKAGVGSSTVMVAEKIGPLPYSVEVSFENIVEKGWKIQFP